MPEKTESPFACEMDAIEPTQRAAHLANAKLLFASVTEIQSLANGYRFILPNDPATLVRTAEFINLERLCCPFFTFKFEVEGENGAVSLSLTGRDGVRSFIEAEIGEFLTQPMQFISLTRQQ